MKKILLLFILIIVLTISGCTKESNEDRLENELKKYNIEEIILSNINIENNESYYAIGINNSLEEVFIKYEKEDNSIKILEVIDYGLSFSYKDLITKINNLENKELKYALLEIINSSKTIEITNTAEIKEVLRINAKDKYTFLTFYYDIDGSLNKFVITYDLGDYYIANETVKEIYYPIYLEYEKFPY